MDEWSVAFGVFLCLMAEGAFVGVLLLVDMWDDYRNGDDGI